jgi:hypothetical protein
MSAYHRDHGVSEIVQLEVPTGSTPSTELVFRAAASISGVVRHDDGTPASGAQIDVTPADAPARWAVTADREGRFAVDAIPGGTYMIEAHPPIVAARQATASMKAVARVELEAGAKKTLELEVPGGREHVRGRIVDDAGQPVAGAAVWAERVWEGVMSPAVALDVRAYSWTDGTFDLDDVPRGTYTIYARHPDGRTGEVNKIPSGATKVSVVVRDGARITGRVVTRDGRPARSFRLQWHWLSRAAAMGQTMSSDARVVHHANGEFTIERLEPTSMISLVVETTDGANGSGGGFALAAGQTRADVRIEVVGLGTVRGRLVRKDTGGPLLGHTVWFPMISTRGIVPVDGDGRFEAQVPPGNYDHINIQSSSMGYPDIPATFTVESGKTVDIGTVTVDPRD